MTIVRAQVVFATESGLPRDRAVNTFHFVRATEPNVAQLEAIAEAVRDFYVVDPDTTPEPRICDLLGGQVKTTGHEIRMYTYDDPTGDRLAYNGAPPEYVELFDFLGDTRQDLATVPSEVAAKVTFRAIASPLVPLAQRTGGVYLGPLNNTGVSNVAGQQEVRPSNDLISAAIKAGNDLITASAGLGAPLAVYSRPFAGRAANTRFRANGTPLPALPARDGIGYIVDQVSMDNALDTQRRRGWDATTRYLVSPYGGS